MRNQVWSHTVTFSEPDLAHTGPWAPGSPLPGPPPTGALVLTAHTSCTPDAPTPSELRLVAMVCSHSSPRLSILPFAKVQEGSEGESFNESILPWFSGLAWLPADASLPTGPHRAAYRNGRVSQAGACLHPHLPGTSSRPCPGPWHARGRGWGTDNPATLSRAGCPI